MDFLLILLISHRLFQKNRSVGIFVSFGTGDIGVGVCRSVSIYAGSHTEFFQKRAFQLIPGKSGNIAQNSEFRKWIYQISGHAKKQVSNQKKNGSLTMSNSRLDGVRKGTRIPDLLLRRQSLYPTELYGPIVLKPAISRGLTPYIVFLGLDNILSEEGIIHGLLLSIYCRVGSHFSRRFELTTELLFFSRLVLALFLRRRTLYPAELRAHIMKFR